MKAGHMVPELGVIEGYFGRPWHHEDRKRVLTQLSELNIEWQARSGMKAHARASLLPQSLRSLAPGLTKIALLGHDPR